MSGATQPIPQSDAALVAAYRGGDQRAAAELVIRHARSVARFLFASGAGTSDVEDLAQETFFRAFRRLESWRQEAPFRSWLFSIAGNILKDEFRRQRGRRVISLEGQELRDATDPEGDLHVAESEGRLRLALAGLPRLQREVFLMRVQQAWSYDEIAGALGTTPGAARVHYHHAVRRLKETIA
jgi:RNA polymerase sigma-70 factor (ECF subfamily)